MDYFLLGMASLLWLSMSAIGMLIWHALRHLYARRLEQNMEKQLSHFSSSKKQPTEMAKTADVGINIEGNGEKLPEKMFQEPFGVNFIQFPLPMPPPYSPPVTTFSQEKEMTPSPPEQLLVAGNGQF